MLLVCLGVFMIGWNWFLLEECICEMFNVLDIYFSVRNFICEYYKELDERNRGECYS